MRSGSTTTRARQEDVDMMGQFALSENEGVTSLNLRTSIVTQPKNGRIPPLTAAAAARRDARTAARKGREFDGPEMRSLTERCILWPSTIAPILPRGYNSNLQIFQSPGYVIIQGEMGDPRMIPTDAQCGCSASGTASSVLGERRTFVIETATFTDRVASAKREPARYGRTTRVDGTLSTRSVVDPIPGPSLGAASIR
jgi:hypothetical protein